MSQITEVEVFVAVSVQHPDAHLTDSGVEGVRRKIKAAVAALDVEQPGVLRVDEVRTHFVMRRPS